MLNEEAPQDFGPPLDADHDSPQQAEASHEDAPRAANGLQTGWPTPSERPPYLEPPFRWKRDQTNPVPFEQLVVASLWNRLRSEEQTEYDLDLGLELYSRAGPHAPGGSWVETYYISDFFSGGAALVWRKRDQTRRKRRSGVLWIAPEEYLDLEYWIDAWEYSKYGSAFSDMAFKIGELRDKLKSLPDSAARQTGMRRLYQIIQYLFGILEDLKSSFDDEGTLSEYDQQRINDSIGAIDFALDAAKEYYESSFARIGEGAYLSGMFRGLIMMLVLATGIAVIGPWSVLALFDVDIQGPGFRAFLIALVAGSLGGLLSVMIRFSRSRLSIRSDVDLEKVRSLGVFRPVVGAIFAVAINIIVLAGLLPQISIAGNVEAFSAAIGFLAGFSERWASDVVTVAEGGITGRAG